MCDQRVHLCNGQLGLPESLGRHVWPRKARGGPIKEAGLELGLGGGRRTLKRQGMGWDAFQWEGGQCDKAQSRHKPVCMGRKRTLSAVYRWADRLSGMAGEQAEYAKCDGYFMCHLG